ncbi:hypothetical protein BSKO_11845 [Bryopsis sp. KO-2023]|nr:hypothetical protein BSKO_11845 [Bryopsis sp. KO-2023]
MGELAAAFGTDAEVRKALDAIDNVRPHLKNLQELADMLPAIVVVGDQSSGKSSTLERLSGVNLPRGEGICTRVPLQLQLRKEARFSAQLEYEPRGLDTKIVEVDGLGEIGDAIAGATMEIAGESKGIHDSPILLRISGPDYEDLTLIDLPGIARVAVQDQPQNIEELTVAMIKKYIAGDAKVILCSLPASAEFVTSAALKLAREVDANGVRTLGVVTKIDQAEEGIARRMEGTHSSDVMLRLGCVAVRCRSQRETEEGMTLKEVEEVERELFTDHPDLRNISASCQGIPALVRKLVAIQRERLIEQLPKIIHQLEEKIDAEERTLDELGDIVENEFQAFEKALMCVNQVSEGLRNRAQGQVDDEDEQMQISLRCSEEFTTFKVQIDGICGGLFDDEVWKEIEEFTRCFQGIHLSNFMASPVFNKVFRARVFNKLRRPAEVLVNKVLKHVKYVLLQLVEETGESTKFQNMLKAMIKEFLEKCCKATQKTVKKCVNSHTEYIETTPMYVDMLEELRGMKENIGPSKVFRLYNDRNLDRHIVDKFTRNRTAIFNMLSDPHRVHMRNQSIQKLESLEAARQALRDTMGFQMI